MSSYGAARELYREWLASEGLPDRPPMSLLENPDSLTEKQHLALQEWQRVFEACN